MDTKHFTAAEDDAIIAGLRLLQCSLEKQPGHHPVEPNDGDVGDILTNSGEHAGLTVAAIERLLYDKFGVGDGLIANQADAER